MFKKILIANRGEIACRIMETAQRMGVRCVAVYSDADAGARHVMLADEAVALGGLTPAESYLKGEAIIAAAQARGADAVHPGYGFLSENPDFVESVEAAGLVFIGPSAAAIRAMGLKDAAKSLMQEAGVPVVPGYHGTNQDPGFLAQQAEKIGYPVLIKAVAGGGGKGMRLVAQPAQFASDLESAQREAQAGFGNPDVLIEKYVSKPRHIEVQIFGDGTRAVHLFERDCSLQRRHQKVIEEAPAPGMTEEMRAAMGAAAVRAAEAIGYKGAGTVEFIVDASDGLRPDRFWFMEMNTRLQVEHPVTEAITGFDLVAWQLSVAAGADLPAQQDELSITGHAFEARLYAEDVAKGFLPATGQISHFGVPTWVRADCGVGAGDEITPYYDPMIGKIIVWGADRAEALQRLRSALAKTEVAGTVTNLAFLSALAADEGFSAGDVDTGLIARQFESLTAAPPVTEGHAAQAALWVIRPHLDGESGFHLWQPLRQSLVLSSGDLRFTAEISVVAPDHVEIICGAGRFVFRAEHGQWRCAGVPIANAHISARAVTLFADPARVFDIIDPLERVSDAQSPSGRVLAPMPGLVKSIEARAGKQVQKGARLAILEAMKMEHSLLAGADGVISAVHVRAGDQVAAGDVLIEMEENET